MDITELTTSLQTVATTGSTIAAAVIGAGLLLVAWRYASKFFRGR